MVEGEAERSERTEDFKFPPVISVGSGKGGVGKTMLSANLARVLSWSGKNVLLVDLDLYNRGATSLIADELIANRPTVSGLLDKFQGQGDELVDPSTQSLEWMLGNPELIRTKDSDGEPTTLFLLPSAPTGKLVDWTEHDFTVPQLKAILKEAVSALSKKYDIACVVFDSRPGPEPLFLSVAGFSDEIILITEAEHVTMTGTFVLYNYLYEQYKYDAQVLLNIHLVLNRIPDKYSLRMMEKIYQEELSRNLGSRPILASIPFDREIFQSFTEFKFVVDSLPKSKFARHVAAMAMRLFSFTHPELVSYRAEELGNAVDSSKVGLFFNRFKPIFKALTPGTSR